MTIKLTDAELAKKFTVKIEGRAHWLYRGKLTRCPYPCMIGLEDNLPWLTLAQILEHSEMLNEGEVELVLRPDNTPESYEMIHSK